MTYDEAIKKADTIAATAEEQIRFMVSNSDKVDSVDKTRMVAASSALTSLASYWLERARDIRTHGK